VPAADRGDGVQPVQARRHLLKLTHLPGLHLRSGAEVRTRDVVDVPGERVTARVTVRVRDRVRVRVRVWVTVRVRVRVRVRIKVRVRVRVSVRDRVRVRFRVRVRVSVWIRGRDSVRGSRVRVRFSDSQDYRRGLEDDLKHNGKML